MKDCDFERFKFKPPPIAGNVEERATTALEHVSYGLECLNYFPVETEDEELEKKKIQEEEENLNMAKPFQAIPMPYAPLINNAETITNDITSLEGNGNTSPSSKKRGKQRKKKNAEKLKLQSVTVQDANAKALLSKGDSQTLPTWQAPKKDDNQSWQTHLKILLYEKASLSYVVLAEKEYSCKNYGSTLRYIITVLRCQKILELICGFANDKVISNLLGRAGDSCFMIVQDWTNIEKHRNDYETKNVIENFITDAFYTMEGLDISKYIETKIKIYYFFK